MPGMDGITFLRTLRKRRSPSPPVLVISGYATLDNAVEAGRLGIAGVLKKPFSSAELLSAIKPLLNLRADLLVEHILIHFSTLHYMPLSISP